MKKIIYLISILLLFVTLVPLLILSLYNHPSSLDDFLVFEECINGLSPIDNLKISLRYSIFPSILAWKFSFMPTMAEIHRMLIFYRLYSVFFIILFALSILFLLQQCNTFFLSLSTEYFFLLYSLLIFIFVNYVQELAFFFYNITISGGYTYGLCLMLFLLGFLLKYHFAKKKILFSVIIALLTFLANGTIEFYSITIGFILFIYLFMHWKNTKQIDFFILFLFLLCFITAISFMFAPYVKEKIYTFSEKVAEPYSVHRLKVWFDDTLHYFMRVFMSSFSLKIILYTIVPAFIIGKSTYKNKCNIHLIYIGIPIIIAILISATLFTSGILYVSKKQSCVMILNLIISGTTILFCAYIFQKIFIIFNMFFIDTFFMKAIINNIKNVQTLYKKNKKKMTIYFLFFIIFYTMNTTIYTRGLPIRQAWKEIITGTAAVYDKEVLQVYKTLLATDDKEVIILSVKTFSNILVLDQLWDINKYLIWPQDVNRCIAPFFNKENIMYINNSLLLELLWN